MKYIIVFSLGAGFGMALKWALDWLMERMAMRIIIAPTMDEGINEYEFMDR